MLVRFEDFEREARIPTLFPSVGSNDGVNIATQRELQEYIFEYEPRFLEIFFDGDFDAIQSIAEYAALSQNLQTDDEKNVLLSGLRKCLARYIAFYYFRDNSVLNTGVGAVIPQPQNSVRTDVVNKCCICWNQMAEYSRKLYIRTFGKEEYCKSMGKSIFERINWAGI